MMVATTSPKQRLPSWVRGLISIIAAPLGWIGRLFGFRLRRFQTAERYDHGLVVILPGIESQSFLNHSIAWGLDDGGWQGAIEIYDWTTTIVLFFLFHLRSWKRNQRQAQRLAERIEAYQRSHPGRPVHLIGHSGGGAISVMALEALPAGSRITSAILLAPALSPHYPLVTALQHTDRGIWNFWSPGDLIFLGAGTLLLGTIDGKWSFSSGMIGFWLPRDPSAELCVAYAEKLHQVPYSWRMLFAFNLGGHFGCTNRVFVEEYVVPVLSVGP